MDSNEILFKQYKLYAEHKENFVNRSFAANKFYFVLVLALILIMFLTKDYSLTLGLNSILIFSAVGMAVSVLWWINMDSYNFLLKVKLSSVIEKLESQMPVKPYTDEFAAIKDLKKNKREFLFADTQKALALFLFLLFFALFANEIVQLIAK